jgi:hypothetical protein
LLDFNGEIEYFNDDDKERKIGNIGKMAIGISYYLSTYNKFEYSNHLCFDKGRYAIYVLDKEITNNEEVYSYSFFGVSGERFGIRGEKENAENRNRIIDIEIQDLLLKASEHKKSSSVARCRIKGIENITEVKREVFEEEIKTLKRDIRKSKNVLKEIDEKIKILKNEKNENEAIINKFLHPYFVYSDWNLFKNNLEKYYLFNNELYYINIEKDRYRYNDEQLKLLLKEYIYKENTKFDKLKKQIELFEKLNSMTENGRKREPIPEDVKFEVWRRDEGKCVICGSKENLEFDHIIPFSKGGGNTVRNLQLLCETCNRKKSDKI